MNDLTAGIFAMMQEMKQSKAKLTTTAQKKQETLAVMRERSGHDDVQLTGYHGIAPEDVDYNS